MTEAENYIEKACKRAFRKKLNATFGKDWDLDSSSFSHVEKSERLPSEMTLNVVSENRVVGQVRINSSKRINFGGVKNISPTSVEVLSVVEKATVTPKPRGRERSVLGRLVQASRKDNQKAQEDEDTVKVAWSNMSEEEKLDLVGFSKAWEELGPEQKKLVMESVSIEKVEETSMNMEEVLKHQTPEQEKITEEIYKKQEEEEAELSEFEVEIKLLKDIEPYKGLNEEMIGGWKEGETVVVSADEADWLIKYNMAEQASKQTAEEDWVIKPKKYKDKRTGEIVTQFNVLDIEYMEEVEEGSKENASWVVFGEKDGEKEEMETFEDETKAKNFVEMLEGDKEVSPSFQGYSFSIEEASKEKASVKMGVYNSEGEIDLQDFGVYKTVKEAKDDWENWDKPRGAHHAIIETDDGEIIYLGKESGSKKLATKENAVSEDLLKETYKMEWKDKPFDEIKTELDRISKISLQEPIQDTQPALYVKFMALGDLLKEQMGAEVAGRTYLKPGEKAPSGQKTQKGPRGGEYYETEAPAKEEPKKKVAKKKVGTKKEVELDGKKSRIKKGSDGRPDSYYYNATDNVKPSSDRILLNPKKVYKKFGVRALSDIQTLEEKIYDKLRKEHGDNVDLSHPMAKSQFKELVKKYVTPKIKKFSTAEQVSLYDSLEDSNYHRMNEALVDAGMKEDME